MHKTQPTSVHLLVDGSLVRVKGGNQTGNADVGLDHQPGAGDLYHIGRVEGQVPRLQVVWVSLGLIGTLSPVVHLDYGEFSSILVNWLDSIRKFFHSI